MNKPSVDQVRVVISALYNESNQTGKEEASEWLQELQRSVSTDYKRAGLVKFASLIATFIIIMRWGTTRSSTYTFREFSFPLSLISSIIYLCWISVLIRLNKQPRSDFTPAHGGKRGLVNFLAYESTTFTNKLMWTNSIYPWISNFNFVNGVGSNIPHCFFEFKQGPIQMTNR